MSEHSDQSNISCEDKKEIGQPKENSFKMIYRIVWYAQFFAAILLFVLWLLAGRPNLF